MLMLINITDIPLQITMDFNTSHVNVNRHNSGNLNSYNCHFNTSHVNVNQLEDGIKDMFTRFQYISC